MLVNLLVLKQNLDNIVLKREVVRTFSTNDFAENGVAECANET